MNEKKLQKEKNATRKNNIALNLVIILLLATIIVSAVIGLYAWAKYTSAINGDAEAQVAKWHFELKGDVSEDVENTLMALTRTDEYEHVAEGKLAPGTYGKLPITIDTRGTEVSLVYDLTVTITNFPQNMILKNSKGQKIIPEVSGDGTEESQRIATITISNYVQYNTVDDNRLHDETITWDWPYETGTEASEINANDEIDTKDAGKKIYVSISVTGTQVMEDPELEPEPEPGPTSSTPVSSLTVADYGQYVDIGTNILGTDNETEADWRVFYKEPEENGGGVWLTLSDYLPVTDGSVGASTVSSVGLETNNTYGIYSTNSRTDLIGKLNGDWSSLISGSNVAEKEGVEVKGAVDLETWVASWNEKYPNSEEYPTNQLAISKSNTWGYTVSRSSSNQVTARYSSLEDPPDPDTIKPVSMVDSEGYIDKLQADKLYFPHTSDIDNCGGYWLASPAYYYTTSNVVSVRYNGYVSSSYYNRADCGVCPAVYLPSNIKIDTSNTVWTIVNE